MESAALAFTQPRRLVRFQSRTSSYHRFGIHRHRSARMRDGLDVELVPTSTQAALRKRYY